MKTQLVIRYGGCVSGIYTQQDPREKQRTGILTRLKATPREIFDNIVIQGRIPRVGHSPRGSSAQRLAREVEEAPALKSDTDERDERQKIAEGEPILHKGDHGSRERLPEAETECTSHRRHGAMMGGERKEEKKKTRRRRVWIRLIVV